MPNQHTKMPNLVLPDQNGMETEMTCLAIYTDDADDRNSLVRDKRSFIESRIPVHVRQVGKEYHLYRETKSMLKSEKLKKHAVRGVGMVKPAIKFNYSELALK